METAKLTAKGQITIPRKVRTGMALNVGDRVAFKLDDDGGARIVPVRHPLKPLRGFLSEYATGRKVDDERIREALRHRAAKKHGRP